MNAFDRAIAAVAPRLAAKRALARVQIDALSRVRQPAGQRRRFAGNDANFGVNTGDPNDARPRRVTDRLTVLKLAFENPYGRKIVNALVNNAVGWGITGAPKGPAALKKLWAEWIKVSDYHGRLNFYGQQELSTRTMFREGEAFIVRQFVRGASVLPLRLQVFDAGMLATDTFGDNIEGGIEYSEGGSVVAFWFHQARAAYRVNREAVRYPAADVIHLFIQEEAGQKRGRSVFEPIVKKLGDIDEALDADLTRRKIESCFVGFRTLSWDAQDNPLGTREPQERLEPGVPPSEYFEPGLLATLEPGEDVKFADPKPAGGLGEVVRTQLLAVAAGAGVTYEHATGDLSHVNYSSYRAGALEFDGMIERVQWNTLIPVALDRVWAWFVEAGFTFGALGKGSYEMRWTPPPRKSIDRKGDAEADILEMQSGLENRRSLLNARGLDHDTFMDETAADLKVQQDKGLFYKGDPFSAAQAAGASSDPVPTA